MAGPAEVADTPEFIARLKDGDEHALEDLMARYQTKVFGLALRMTGQRQDAEEVLQDVFMTVFQKIHTFRGEAKLSTWIYRVTTNMALMKLRRRPKVRMLPLEEELGPGMTEEGHLAEPVVDWSRLPDAEVQRKELIQRLAESLDKLPAEYRSVVVLRDIEGLSAEETSDILKISVAALKSRLHRARLFLRKQLTDYVTTGSGGSQEQDPGRDRPAPQRPNPGARHAELS